MRRVLLVIVLVLSALRLHLPAVSSSLASDGAGYLPLYAHTDYAARAFGGKILNTAPPYGLMRQAPATEENSFYTYPALSAPLHVRGTIEIRIWLRSSISTIGNVSVVISEIRADGSRMTVAYVLGRPPLANRISPYYFYAPVEHIFERGSTIRLYVLVTDVSPGAAVTLYWDDQATPTQVVLPLAITEARYHALQLQTVDSDGRPMPNANITILQNSIRIWTGRTNSTGWTTSILPSSEDVGQYSIEVYWRDSLVLRMENFRLTHDAQLTLRCSVYSLTLLVSDSFNRPLGGVDVKLLRDSSIFALGNTSSDGSLTFTQVPRGEYVMSLSYTVFKVLGFSSVASVTSAVVVEDSRLDRFTISLFPAWLPYVGVAFLLVAISAVGILAKRKTRKLHDVPFEFFDIMSGGGIQAPSIVMIRGNPGSGKTVLAQHLTYESLRKGRPCVFITTTDFPSKIRKDMTDLGLGSDALPAAPELAFIDCYSGAAGQTSTEKHHVSSLTDLTSIGVKASVCLSELGSGADVFFDSLAPLFTMLRPDFIVTFVHSVGAKVKGLDGKFVFTVGTGIEKDVLTRLEGVSDCVIEMEAYEQDESYQRKMRIKKMRGRYLEKWVKFSITQGKGIIFHLEEKPEKATLVANRPSS